MSDHLKKADSDALDKAILSVASAPDDVPPVPSSYVDEAALVGGVIAIAALVYLAYKKRWLSWKRLSYQAKRILSGWGVWILLVLAYVLLLNPYGGALEDDEITNLLLWLILPPLVTVALYKWVRQYGPGSKSGRDL